MAGGLGAGGAAAGKAAWVLVRKHLPRTRRGGVAEGAAHHAGVHDAQAAMKVAAFGASAHDAQPLVDVVPDDLHEQAWLERLAISFELGVIELGSPAITSARLQHLLIPGLEAGMRARTSAPCQLCTRTRPRKKIAFF